MVERISELDTASFVEQLKQKCTDYCHKESMAAKDKLVSDWDKDVVYGIQQQIVYNADALLGGQVLDDEVDRRNTSDIIFWYDQLRKKSDDGTTFVYPHEGFWNNQMDGDGGRGRISQKDDPQFASHPEFEDERIEKDPPDEEEENLSNMPKTHAANSLVEISEWLGPGHPDAHNSNYVSRKVPLIWFFNVIKAIVDLKRFFRWLIIGGDTEDINCSHPEAECDPDKSNTETTHTNHTFKRSKNPSLDGSIKVYGNAQFNGQVTTFHTQTRFHEESRFWDTVRVFGQSYFSKDINGTAMRVRWGDLAEFYSADKNYEPGTLVKFGGSEEITISDDVANAVVTTKPGLVLNTETGFKIPVAIALEGRVPVKVWGSCKKFDLLVPDPDHPGYATARTYLNMKAPIARALECKLEGSDRAVLCTTRFSI